MICIATSAPAAMHNRIQPSNASPSAKRSFMVAICGAHPAIKAPCTRNVAVTANRVVAIEGRCTDCVVGSAVMMLNYGGAREATLP